jgi:CRISPR-associated endonuclease/helicase Cas3
LEKISISATGQRGESSPLDKIHFARGCWDGDELPRTDLGDSVTAPRVKLSLETMELGLCEQSPFTARPRLWDRILRVRDKLGPLRLAYLEALLRAFDWS